MDAAEENRLAKKYMRLAWRVAAKHARKWGGTIDQDELFGQACLLLVQGIREFDPERSPEGNDGIGGFLGQFLQRRLTDYIRMKVGKQGQRIGLVLMKNNNSIRLTNYLTTGDSKREIDAAEALEATEKLLSFLPGKRALVMRCLLRHNFGPDGVREAMRLAELSESRVSQIRQESVAMLADLGVEKVLEILF